ncbi:MAG: hypothetical protein WD399_08095 [Thermoleophilaceae bacterium]
MAGALEVKLSGGYRFEQIERLIRDIQPVANLDAPRVVTLDMGGLAFIGPAGLALVVACLKRAVEAGLLAEGSSMVPPRSFLTARYLMRMDLFAHLAGVDVPEPFARKRPVGFRPCAHFADQDGQIDVARSLKDALVEQCVVDDIASSAIYICLDELTENVLHHAATDRGGFAAAQGWRGRSEFEIGIADMGVGIRASLAKNPDYSAVVDDAGAIVTALRPRVTSTPERNAGIGLFITKLLLAANGGTLMVRSGYGAVRSGASEEVATAAVELPGTLVALRARTDRPLDIRDVYRELEPEDQDAQDNGSPG